LDGVITCYVMNRRGRGRSGKHGAEHSILREVEDIQAVMQEAGPGAALLGHSSGGVFALEAAMRGNVDTLILYEPAALYVADASAIPRALAVAYAAELADNLVRQRKLIESGDLDAAIGVALTLAFGTSDADLAQMRAAPDWPKVKQGLSAWLRDREALGHDKSPFDARRVASLRSRTLLLRGTASPESLRNTVTVLGNAIRRSEVVELEDQGHGAHLTAPQLMADALRAFLNV
jgi:pimeloyl-ACP methyl ester carboxylesterase